MGQQIKTDKNYYEILEIEKYSAVDAVKKAYKGLVKRYHPDANKDKNADEIYKKIVKAYTVLKDFQLKEEYDNQLKKEVVSTPKMSFEFTSYNFFINTDKLLNSIKIFFKNITGQIKREKIRLNENSGNILDENYHVSEDILNMSSGELEERLLYSDNKYVRLNAGIAIGIKNEKASLPVLENVLPSSDKELKKIIIWAIGNLKMKKSLNLLKILYNSAANEVKSEILKAYYKITEGKGNILINMLLNALKENDNELKITALELFFMTNKKIEYFEIKKLLNTSSKRMNDLIDKLVKDNRVVNFQGGQ
ncbi:MAG: DnaJ domain-containing protein [Spirochaetes bacterium]|nr:DnaJ domain-containing protein [Spirochaetota bacterium]